MIKRLITSILCLTFVVLAQPQVEPGYTEYPASGMLLGSKDMSLYVVFVYGNSRAESVGIKAGDFVIQIQQDQEAMFIEPIYAANMINAYPVGSNIMVRVERDNKQYTYKFLREDITLPDQLWPAKQNDKWGYIDLSGTMFIPLIFDQAEIYSDDLALVKIDGQYKYINKMGQTEFTVKSGYKPFSFQEDMAMFEYNGKYGFMNKNGAEVIRAQYDFVQGFSEGLCAVEVNKKYGYIDKQGIMVITPQYEDANNFQRGLAQVIKDNLMMYIDKTGKTVWQESK